MKTVAPGRLPAMTVIRPVCGLDDVERHTLASTFELPRSTELIFCAAREADPAVSYLRRLIAERPGWCASILIGQEGPGANPKLDNVRKGWRVARNNWVVIADSNVLMDETYLWNLLSAWGHDVGAVCAPPVAVDGDGLWADVERQWLNTYQARWQYAADALGYGFAQGKSMLFDKRLLDRWGGIDALDIDKAEDAAATKVVRAHGHRIRLAPAAIPQPLSRRTIAQVWQRQCRWAQLRRKSFPLLYLIEPFSMLLPVAGLAVFGAASLDLAPMPVVLILCLVWFAAERGLAAVAGWPRSVRSIAAAMLREFMLPLVWLMAWRAKPVQWRQPASAPLRARPA